MSFDFASVAVKDETRELEIRHPATKALLATLTVLPVTADKPTEVKRRQERRRFKNPRGFKLDPVEMDNDALDVLAACTVAWRTPEGGNIVLQGQELECNAANARRLFETVKWVRDEVETAVYDVSFFLEQSQTSSENS